MKILFEGPCIEINGVAYRHHPHGGGLVAEKVQVPQSTMVDYESRVEPSAVIGCCSSIRKALISRGAIIGDGCEISNATIEEGVEVPSGTVINHNGTVGNHNLFMFAR